VETFFGTHKTYLICETQRREHRTTIFILETLKSENDVFVPGERERLVRIDIDVVVVVEKPCDIRHGSGENAR
jgi:hypothetical protein